MADKWEEKESKDIGTREAKTGSDRPTQTIRWDDSKMMNAYANVCNVSSTREEVTLLFGTNQSWHTGQPELTVQLSARIILNPFAAKRLSMLLNNIVKEYESRFGSFKNAEDSGYPIDRKKLH